MRSNKETLSFSSLFHGNPMAFFFYDLILLSTIQLITPPFSWLIYTWPSAWRIIIRFVLIPFLCSLWDHWYAPFSTVVKCSHSYLYSCVSSSPLLFQSCFVLDVSCFCCISYNESYCCFVDHYFCFLF